MGALSWRFYIYALFAVFAAFSFPALTSAQYDGTGGIDPLTGLEEIYVCITGDRFDYLRDEGLLIIEGNTVVSYSDFVIECDTLEVISDGREKPVLHAYPSVRMKYGDSLGEFTGGEFIYDFNTGEGGFGQVEGVFHLDPDRMDIDIEVPLDVHFQAEALELYADRIVLTKPWFGLGRGGKSDLRFYSLEIVANIENSRITSTELDRFVVRIFGVKITLLPIRLRHGFVKHSDIGLTGYLPTISFEHDDGLGIDQRLFYTFHTSRVDENFISFRLNPYLFDRFYWQVGLNHDFKTGRASLIYGPERIEDPYDEGQVVWSKPDFRFIYDLPGIGDWRHTVKAYWGDIREASTGVEKARHGFSYEVDIKPAEYGNAGIGLSGKFKKSYYAGGDEYWELRRAVSFRYDAGEDFDYKVTYFKVDDGGVSPFLFDQVEVREGVGFRAQAFFSDRWGFATDLLYDLDRDFFDRLGFGPIWVSTSLQIGLVWDFEDKTVRLIAGLPKQFN